MEGGMRKEEAHQNYVFGYGSLMCRHSRAATIGTSDSLATITPVILHGWRVQWSTRTPYHMTALGIVPATTAANHECTGPYTTITNASTASSACGDERTPDCDSDDGDGTALLPRLAARVSSTNMSSASAVGVLIPVTADELIQFDQREGDEYQRTRVAMRDVHLFVAAEPDSETTTTTPSTRSTVTAVVTATSVGAAPHAKEQRVSCSAADAISPSTTSTITPDMLVWVYVQVIPEQPSPLYPIAQSYLDVILRGCLDISPDFAAAFLQLVQKWQSDDTDDAATVTSTTTAPTEELSSQSRRLRAYVNDRTAPIYIRGDIEWSRAQAAVLDDLIRTHQPVAFQNRQCL